MKRGPALWLGRLVLSCLLLPSSGHPSMTRAASATSLRLPSPCTRPSQGQAPSPSSRWQWVLRPPLSSGRCAAETPHALQPLLLNPGTGGNAGLGGGLVRMTPSTSDLIALRMVCLVCRPLGYLFSPSTHLASLCGFHHGFHPCTFLSSELSFPISTLTVLPAPHGVCIRHLGSGPGRVPCALKIQSVHFLRYRERLSPSGLWPESQLSSAQFQSLCLLVPTSTRLPVPLPLMAFE